MAKVITSLPRANYPVMLREYILRTAKYILERIQEHPDSFPSDQRELALHTLSFTLKLPEAWPLTRNLLLLIAPKMEQAGYRDEWIAYLESGIEQSQQLGDAQAEAELRFYLGELYHYQAKYDDARTQFEASAAYFEQVGNTHHQARALNRLAACARRLYDFEEARELAHTALAKTTAKEEMGYSNFVLAAIALDERDWQNAIDFYEKSLALWELTDNQRLIAWGLGNLGTALRKLERDDEARHCYERAINLFETIQDPVHQAVTRMNLGNVYLKLGQSQAALKFYLLAEAEFDKTKTRISLAQVNFNKGLAYEKLDQWDKAQDVYLTSIALWQQIGTISSVVKVMARLGVVYLAQEDCDQAINIYQYALSKLPKIKNDPIHNHLSTLLTTHLDEAMTQCLSTSHRVACSKAE